VIVVGLGEVQTDENGGFSVPGATPGINYSITVQKTGVSFRSGTFTASSGSFVAVTGSLVPFNPLSCPSSDYVAALVSSSDAANNLRTETLKNAKRIPARARLRLLSGEVILAAELPQRVEEQFFNYQSASRTIPEIVLTCTSGSACSAVDLRPGKLTMQNELDNLSHERLLVNRVLRLRGKITRVVSDRFIRATKRERARAKRLVGQFLDESRSCS
jgi:hypothetical protein